MGVEFDPIHSAAFDAPGWGLDPDMPRDAMAMVARMAQRSCRAAKHRKALTKCGRCREDMYTVLAALGLSQGWSE